MDHIIVLIVGLDVIVFFQFARERRQISDGRPIRFDAKSTLEEHLVGGAWQQYLREHCWSPGHRLLLPWQTLLPHLRVAIEFGIAGATLPPEEQSPRSRSVVMPSVAVVVVSSCRPSSCRLLPSSSCPSSLCRPLPSSLWSCPLVVVLSTVTVSPVAVVAPAIGVLRFYSRLSECTEMNTQVCSPAK